MFINHFVDPGIVSRMRNHPDNNCIPWPNVVVQATTGNYYKQAPETAFSIFSNLKGKVTINLNNQTKRVCEETFLLVTPFQKLEYEVIEKIYCQNVHFEWEFFIDVWNSLATNDETLLEGNSFQMAEEEVINQLYYKDDSIKHLLNSFSDEDEDYFFLDLVQAALNRDKKARKSLQKITSKKESTRKELYKRMMLAKDVVYSRYNESGFMVDHLCKEVGMSKYHFLRVFKEVFGLSPGKMLKTVRLERARFLVENTHIPIVEIANEVGFLEPNSIFPIFKAYLKTSPSRYREISNFQ